MLNPGRFLKARNRTLRMESFLLCKSGSFDWKRPRACACRGMLAALFSDENASVRSSDEAIPDLMAHGRTHPCRDLTTSRRRQNTPDATAAADGNRYSKNAACRKDEGQREGSPSLYLDPGWHVYD